jgi:hypothetical protein
LFAIIFFHGCHAGLGSASRFGRGLDPEIANHDPEPMLKRVQHKVQDDTLKQFQILLAGRCL